MAIYIYIYHHLSLNCREEDLNSFLLDFLCFQVGSSHSEVSHVPLRSLLKTQDLHPEDKHIFDH